MATKALKEVGSLTYTEEAVPSSTISLINFNPGDTAYLTWGAYQLPVIVQKVFLTGYQTAGGDNAVYIVEGDVTTSVPYTGGPRGPIRVTADQLSSR